MVRERQRILGALLANRRGRSLQESYVLDAGCGWGHTMAWLARIGVPAGHLTGVDMMPNRLAAARKTYSDFTFLEANLEKLEMPSESYDLVACTTLFSSIRDDAVAAKVATNIRRMLRPDGAVVWYDIRYPNPWNSDVRAMTPWRIRSLFPTLSVRLRSMTLIPQLSRRLGPAIGAYRVFAVFPPLRTHLGGLLEAGDA
jgi:ubiquinone/menaquinone biosynthesis C-methylase UbiE